MKRVIIHTYIEANCLLIKCVKTCHAAGLFCVFFGMLNVAVVHLYVLCK